MALVPSAGLVFQGDLLQFPSAGGVEPARPQARSLVRLLDQLCMGRSADRRGALASRHARRRKNGSDPLLVRTFGGSIHISPFVSTLGVPAVVVPTVNPDNNQHSSDENLRLGEFLDGSGPSWGC